MRKFIGIFILLFSLQLLNAQEITRQGELKVHTINGKEYYIHVVEAGNTLYAISRRYAISIEDLKEENPRLTQELTIGDRLLIPLSAVKRKDLEESPEIDGNYIIHEVQKKNTLYSIAKEYQLAITDITAANPMVMEGLKKGMKLRIPVAKIKSEEPEADEYIEPAAASPYVTHEVQPKETLYSLSRLYNVSIDSLKQVNNGLPGGLQEGTLINIPILRNASVKKDTLMMVEFDSAAVKSSYQVSLLMPLYLDMLEIAEDTAGRRAEEIYDQLFSKSQYGLEFYQGFKMAADSVVGQGLSLELTLFDSANDTSRVREILRKPGLKNSDLIVGPLYLDEFLIAADFAKKHNINIVSPVKQSNKILLGNNYVSKVATSGPVMMRFLGRYLADSLQGHNLMLIYPDHIKERKNAELVKNEYLKHVRRAVGDSAIKIGLQEVLYDGQSFQSVRQRLDSNRLNVVVVPSEDQASVTSLLTSLYSQSDYEIMVIGTEAWDKYDNLEIAYLHKLNVHLITSEYIDPQHPNTRRFEREFFQRYQYVGGKFAMLGFDVGMYYLNFLHRFGTNFEVMFLGYQEELLSHKFEFFKTGIESGYENHSVYVVRYRDFRMERAY
jgi:LysM repeat protein